MRGRDTNENNILINLKAQKKMLTAVGVLISDGAGNSLVFDCVNRAGLLSYMPVAGCGRHLSGVGEGEGSSRTLLRERVLAERGAGRGVRGTAQGGKHALQSESGGLSDDRG